jgi:succinate dehydrogenase/fumarate reductase flavoprotein subunit
MAPLRGRLHALPVQPSAATTTGGPRRDAAARVLRWDGAPIPGLLAAGGTGSVWGHLTHHGGGLTDGLVFGPIAARTAALQEG